MVKSLAELAAERAALSPEAIARELAHEAQFAQDEYLAYRYGYDAPRGPRAPISISQGRRH